MCIYVLHIIYSLNLIHDSCHQIIISKENHLPTTFSRVLAQVVGCGMSKKSSRSVPTPRWTSQNLEWSNYQPSSGNLKKQGPLGKMIVFHILNCFRGMCEVNSIKFLEIDTLTASWHVLQTRGNYVILVTWITTSYSLGIVGTFTSTIIWIYIVYIMNVWLQ